jgi:large subunit ribosomal protein L29
MDIKEIRAMSPEDQNKQLHERLREQFSLRMQKATGQLGNTSQLGKVKREIARILTVMNEKKGAA